MGGRDCGSNAQHLWHTDHNEYSTSLLDALLSLKHSICSGNLPLAITDGSWNSYRTSKYGSLCDNSSCGMIRISISITDIIYFSTYTLPCFNELYNLFYLSGKKVIPNNIGDLLTPLSLAYWIADEGSWNKTQRYV